MNDLLQVRFIELRGEPERGVDLSLTSDKIPRLGSSFALFAGLPPVRIVASCLRPNSDSGVHWLITYKRGRRDRRLIEIPRSNAAA